MKTMLSSVNGVLPRPGRTSFKTVTPQPNKLFQTSTMAALLDAVYDGEVTVEALLNHGDFGIGTFNALDGEMIVNDGVVYQFRSGGHAGAVLSDLRTPFACVTYFEPETRIVIDAPKDKKEFETLVDELVGNPNLFVAVRFIGAFDDVETRTVFSQHPPYPRCSTSCASSRRRNLQPHAARCWGFARRNTCRASALPVTTCIFWMRTQKMGGHVTGYRLREGRLELAVISDFEIQLPRTRQFREANLSPDDIHAAIRFAEGE